MQDIPAIDLEISGICNLRCPGCWGTPRMMKQLHDWQDWFNLVKFLKEAAGLKSVTLCGGEPTLNRGVDDFTKRISVELNQEVYLETNGFFLIPLLPKMAPYLTNVSLSLEGSTPEVNAYRRGPVAFKKVLDCLDYLNEKYPTLPVKIGTCVFKPNAEDVPNIGDVLLQHGFEKRFPNLGVWKLYQATKFGAGKNDPEWPEMEVTKEEFESVSEKCKKRYEGKISFTSISSAQTGGYCIIVRPNGNVVSNAHSELGEEYLVYEDIFKNPRKGVEAIKNFQSEEHVKNRLVNTYFFDWQKVA